MKMLGHINLAGECNGCGAHTLWSLIRQNYVTPWGLKYTSLNGEIMARVFDLVISVVRKWKD